MKQNFTRNFLYLILMGCCCLWQLQASAQCSGPISIANNSIGTPLFQVDPCGTSCTDPNCAPVVTYTVTFQPTAQQVFPGSETFEITSNSTLPVSISVNGDPAVASPATAVPVGATVAITYAITDTYNFNVSAENDANGDCSTPVDVNAGDLVGAICFPPVPTGYPQPVLMGDDLVCEAYLSTPITITNTGVAGDTPTTANWSVIGTVDCNSGAFTANAGVCGTFSNDSQASADLDVSDCTAGTIIRVQYCEQGGGLFSGGCSPLPANPDPCFVCVTLDIEIQEDPDITFINGTAINDDPDETMIAAADQNPVDLGAVCADGTNQLPAVTFTLLPDPDNCTFISDGMAAEVEWELISNLCSADGTTDVGTDPIGATGDLSATSGTGNIGISNIITENDDNYISLYQARATNDDCDDVNDDNARFQYKVCAIPVLTLEDTDANYDLTTCSGQPDDWNAILSSSLTNGCFDATEFSIVATDNPDVDGETTTATAFEANTMATPNADTSAPTDFGNVIGEILTNNTLVPQTVTYTVTARNADPDCTSCTTTETFEVTVEPAASFDNVSIDGCTSTTSMPITIADFSGSETVIDFEGLAIGTTVTNQFSGVTFSSPTNPLEPSIDSGSGVLPPFTLSNFTASGTTDNTITITFSTPINIFGFDIATNSLDDADVTLFCTIGGTSVGAPITFITSITPTFQGFQSATPFDQITIDVTSVTNGAFVLDNLRFELLPGECLFCPSDNFQVEVGTTPAGATFDWELIQDDNCDGALDATETTVITPLVGTNSGTGTVADGAGFEIDEVLMDAANQTGDLICGLIVLEIDNGDCPDVMNTEAFTICPEPVLAEVMASDVCSGSATDIEVSSNLVDGGRTTTNDDGRTTYTVTATPNANVTGEMDIAATTLAAGTNLTIAQTLTNTTSCTETVTYTINAVNEDCNMCAAEPLIVTVDVLPNIDVVDQADSEFCSEDGAQTFGPFVTTPAGGAVMYTVSTADANALGIAPQGTIAAGATLPVTIPENITGGDVSYCFDFIAQCDADGTPDCDATVTEICIVVQPEPVLDEIDDLRICSGGTFADVDLTAMNGVTFTYSSSYATGCSGTGFYTAPVPPNTVNLSNNGSAGVGTANPAQTPCGLFTTFVTSPATASVSLASLLSDPNYPAGGVIVNIQVSVNSGEPLGTSECAGVPEEDYDLVLEGSTVLNDNIAQGLVWTTAVNSNTLGGSVDVSAGPDGLGLNNNDVVSLSVSLSVSYTIPGSSGNLPDPATAGTADAAPDFNFSSFGPFTNTGTTSLSETVTVIPTSADGCEGEPITFDLIIDPEPVYNDGNYSGNDVCSGANINVNLQDFRDLVTNGVMATDFSWTASSPTGNVTGFTATQAAGVPTTTIMDQLFLTTGTTGTVEYVVTPLFLSADCPTADVAAMPCAGDPFTVTVIVDEADFATPDILSPFGPYCDSDACVDLLDESQVNLTLISNNLGPNVNFRWLVNGQAFDNDQSDDTPVTDACGNEAALGAFDFGVTGANFCPNYAGAGTYIICLEFFEDGDSDGEPDVNGCITQDCVEFIVYPEFDPTPDCTTPICGTATMTTLTPANMPNFECPVTYGLNPPTPMSVVLDPTGSVTELDEFAYWTGPGVTDIAGTATANFDAAAAVMALTGSTAANLTAPLTVTVEYHVGYDQCRLSQTCDIVIYPDVDATVSNISVCNDTNKQVDLTQMFTDGTTTTGGIFTFMGVAPAGASINGDILTYTTPGIFNITYTVGVGTGDCTATMDASVTVIDVLVEILNPTNADCAGTANGSATVTLAAGNTGTGTFPGDYIFLWSDGQTTQTASNLAAGGYIVIVTDAAGCKGEAAVTITDPLALEANISQQQNITCTENGSATVTATNGTAPYTYTWSASANNQTTAQATDLPVGLHTVTVADAGTMCDLVLSVNITDESVTPYQVFFDIPEQCNYRAIDLYEHLTVADNANVSVDPTTLTDAEFSLVTVGSGTLSGTDMSIYEPTTGFDGFVTIRYTIPDTDTDGADCTVIAEETIELRPAITGTAACACADNDPETPRTVTVSGIGGGLAPYTVSVAGGNTLTYPATDATEATFIMNENEVSYEVTITDARGCIMYIVGECQISELELTNIQNSVCETDPTYLIQEKRFLDPTVIPSGTVNYAEPLTLDPANTDFVNPAFTDYQGPFYQVEAFNTALPTAVMPAPGDLEFTINVDQYALDNTVGVCDGDQNLYVDVYVDLNANGTFESTEVVGYAILPAAGSADYPLSFMLDNSGVLPVVPGVTFVDTAGPGLAAGLAMYSTATAVGLQFNVDAEAGDCLFSNSNWDINPASFDIDVTFNLTGDDPGAFTIVEQVETLLGGLTTQAAPAGLLTDNADGTATVDPAAVVDGGTFIVTYCVGDGINGSIGYPVDGCVRCTEEVFTIYPSYDACFDLLMEVCIDGADIILAADENIETDFATNNFFGQMESDISRWSVVNANGVTVDLPLVGDNSGDATFDPDAAGFGPGTYTITHSVGYDICQTECVATIVVQGAVSAELEDVLLECVVAPSGNISLDALFTSATTSGGTFTAGAGFPATGGMINGNTLTYTAAGCYPITYTVTSIDGATTGACFAEATAFVYVTEQPTPAFDLEEQFCWDGSTGVTLASLLQSVDANYTTTPTRTWTSSDNAVATVDANGVVTIVDVTDASGSNTIQICLEEDIDNPTCNGVGSQECTATVCHTLTIIETSIAVDPSWTQFGSLCIDEAAVDLDALVTGNTDGVFTGIGVSTDGSHPNYIFDPAVAGAGTHTVCYTAGNGAGCDAVECYNIVVNPAIDIQQDFTVSTDVCLSGSNIDLTTYLQATNECQEGFSITASTDGDFNDQLQYEIVDDATGNVLYTSPVIGIPFIAVSNNYQFVAPDVAATYTINILSGGFGETIEIADRCDGTVLATLIDASLGDSAPAVMATEVCQASINIEWTQDNYPNEVFFNILDASGTVIQTYGPGLGTNFSPVTETFNLSIADPSAGPFNLQVFDGFGDGTGDFRVLDGCSGAELLGLTTANIEPDVLIGGFNEELNISIGTPTGAGLMLSTMNMGQWYADLDCNGLTTGDALVGSDIDISTLDMSCFTDGLYELDVCYNAGDEQDDLNSTIDACNQQVCFTLSIHSLDATIDVVNTTCPGDDNTASDGSLTVNPVFGTTPYTYRWSTGETTQMIDGLTAGGYTVTVTDANGCQNVFAAEVLEGVDASNPMVMIPAVLTLDCADINSTTSPAATIDAWLASATATDNCDNDPTLTYDFDMSQLDICAAADYNITVTWIATDASGNSSTGSQIITVEVDDTAPVFAQVGTVLSSLDFDGSSAGFTSFGGGLTSASNTNLEISYTQAGSACFEGTSSGSLTTALNFSTATQLCFDYFEPNATGTLLFKLEDSGSANEWEILISTTAGWNSYCVADTDLATSGPNTGNPLTGNIYDVVVLFPEFYCFTGVQTGQDGTYLFDNLTTNDGTTTTVVLDFQTPATDATFGTFGNGTLSTAPNTALEIMYDQTASSCFSGTGSDPLASPLDFSTPSQLCFDYFESNATGTLLFKLEDSGSANEWEITINTTAGWNTYCIADTDLATSGSNVGNPLTGDVYDIVVLFPEFYCGTGIPTGQDGTYYFDNLENIATEPVTVDLTLDCASISSTTDPTTIVTQWLENNYQVSDDCQLVEVTYDYTPTALDVCTASTTAVTWTATDACGNSSTISANLIIDPDVTAPTADPANPMDETVACGNDIPAVPTITWSDNCNDNAINVDFSEVITTDDNANQQVLTRTWIASDACGNVTTVDQVITIDDMTAPVLTAGTAPMDMTVECGDLIPAVAAPTFTDNCGDEFTVEFSEVVSDQDCANGFVLTRTWTATDLAGNTGTPVVQVITVDDTMAPVPSVANPADETVACGDAIPAVPTITWTDNCVDDVVVDFSEVITTDDNANQQVLTRTWMATDLCGNVTTIDQVITIDDMTAPVLTAGTAPMDMTVECGDLIPAVAAPTFTDNCGDEFTVEFSEVVSDQDCANGFVLTRTWTATDLAGNTGTPVVQVITVDDTMAPVPSVANPADETVACGDLIPAVPVITWTDNCVDDVVVDFSEVITTDDNANQQVLTRTWMATDLCGNVTTIDQVITINDMTAPVLSGTAPMDMTVECGDLVPAVLAPTFTDNCGNEFTVDFSEVVSDQDCANGFVLIRTWTATDLAGNIGTPVVQVITVDDTMAPTAAVPMDVTVECGDAIPAVPTVTFMDNCGDVVNVDFSEIQVDSEFDNEYQLVRTWVGTDACGNATTITQTVTVEDTTPPSITCPATQMVDADVNCDFYLVDYTSGATVSDNCDIATVTQSPAPGTLITTGTTMVTLTVTDDAGLTNTCMFDVIANDNTNPVALCKDIQIELDDVTGTATIIGADIDNGSFDNCTDVSMLTIAASQTIFGCADLGINPITLTVTDAAGNSATCIANVEVIGDDVVTVQNATLEECPNVPEQDVATFDLTEAMVDVAGGNNVTFYMSQLGAENADPADVIANPTAFDSQTKTVFARIDNGVGCFNLVAIWLTVNDSPDPDPNPWFEFCEADLPQAIDGNPVGGSGTYTTHTWAGEDVAILDPATTDTPTPSVLAGTEPGVYKLTYQVTDDAGCISEITHTKVLVHPSPIITACTSTPTVCDGDRIELSSTTTDGTLDYTYEWTEPVTGFTSTDEDPSIRPSDAGYPTTPGTYTYTVVLTDDNGCTDEATVDVVFNNTPVAIDAADVTNAIFCSSNKAQGNAPVKPTQFGTSVLTVDASNACADVTLGGGPVCDGSTPFASVNWYDVPTGGTPLFDADTDNDDVNDADLDGNSSTFDPIAGGYVDATVPGVYTFYAESVCSQSAFCTATTRTPVTITVLDCGADTDECTYLLVLEDSGANGWDGASIDVSVNEGPTTNYKVTPTDCDLLIIPISANDGGLIDITYWNGALENEHSWYLLDPLGNIALDQSNVPAMYGPAPPANQTVRVKLNCPENCSETEDYRIVIGMGASPSDMSWELFDGNDDILVTRGAGDYDGQAPGSVIVDTTLSLNSCEDLVFKAYDGTGNGWAGGTWSIQGTDPDRGTAVLDGNGNPTGFYEIASGPGIFDVEKVSKFTIPCKPTDCPADITLTLNDPANCQITEFTPPAIPTPFVCYPNCEHAIPAPLVTVSYPTIGQANIATTTAVDLPAGQNPVIFEITYTDGSIVRCSSTVSVITTANPNLACNDGITVSLQAPFNGVSDCEVEVTPDMVLEEVLDCEGQYIVTVFDLSGNSLGNTVGAAEAGQTLEYQVQHLGNGNICWGTLTVEDKHAPIVECQNYEIACNHPFALDEDYTHTESYDAYAGDLPANIAGNAGSEADVAVEVGCAPLGEVVTGIALTINTTHSRLSDLSVSITAPNGANVVTSVPANQDQLNAFLGANFTDYEGTWDLHIVDNNGSSSDGDVGKGKITGVQLQLTAGFPKLNNVVDCTYDGDLVLLSEDLIETECDQSDWLGAKIIRTWQAIDAFGNSSTCTQEIGLRAPSIDDIHVPEEVAIECGTEQLDANGAIDVAQSGTPQFDCFDIQSTQHSLCDVSIAYTDNTLPSCGNGYKVIRTWTVVSWCTGVTNTYIQSIKVEDTVGPAINIADIIVGTSPYDCTAGAIQLAPALTDNCSGVQQVTATYTEGGGAYNASGTLVIVDITNGQALENLPFGVTQIEITASDNCGNTTNEIIDLNVADNTAPIAICDDELHVSLGSDGTALLSAADVDEGSYDNCSDITLEVRRTDGCLGTTDWASTVPFECCDVNELVTVELRVTDAGGNSNVCWKEVLVEDALAPVIECAADLTIDCDDPAIHDPFGTPTAIDNCSNVTLTVSDGGGLDQCQAGTLTRTWVASDGSDKSADVTCTQRVTVNHVSDFIVQFPADVTLTNCAIQETGEPTITNDDCELIAISSEDLILDLVNGACYQIERTWTITNWCIYDESADNTDLGIPQPLPRTFRDDDGFFQYVQVITVSDSDAPTITCPGDQIFDDLTDDCEGIANLTIEAEDACSPMAALEYSYKIDAFNDGNGTFDIIGEGNDASGVYPYGTHLIKWIVEDGCGNTSDCSYLFTIRDAKNPTPVCLNGVSLPGMNSDGCVEIWASDLLEYAFDNCSNDDFVEGTVRIREEGDTAAPQTAITLCCADGLGTRLVEVWVEDEAGNADFCTTYIVLQDPNGVCSDGDDARMIAGTIEDNTGDMVEDVMVKISGSNGMTNEMPTAADGQYTFNNLPMNADYTVTPEKNNDPLNGVTTFDLVLISQHILGKNEFTNPYQLIAADVNSDGIITTFDIVQTRQLILFVVQNFPSNTSWRFVDKDYNFPVPTNPWMEAFPESIDVNNLTNDEMMENFIGIKIGDVNGDATSNSLIQTEDRNMDKTLELWIDDAKMKKGATSSIDIKASNFNNINGYQFTLDFDQSSMNFINVEAGALQVSAANFGLTLLEEGVITTSWNNDEGVTIADDETLFTLNFEITEEVSPSEVLNVSSRYTSIEAYTDTDLMNVALNFNSESVSNDDVFELIQNNPNPFKDQTTIGFVLPTATNATIRIMDVTGKVLKVIEGDFNKGYNSILVERNDLQTVGVLYYTLDASEFTATKKMIILE